MESNFDLLASKGGKIALYYISVCSAVSSLTNVVTTRNGPAQARVMMKSVLSSAEHGRCPHKYQNWEQLLAFQYLRVG